jgi:hypothetical protein
MISRTLLASIECGETIPDFLLPSTNYICVVAPSSGAKLNFSVIFLFAKITSVYCRLFPIFGNSRSSN